MKITIDELKCPCCGKKDIDLHFLWRLRLARDLANTPFHINSGVRCLFWFARQWFSYFSFSTTGSGAVFSSFIYFPLAYLKDLAAICTDYCATSTYRPLCFSGKIGISMDCFMALSTKSNKIFRTVIRRINSINSTISFIYMMDMKLLSRAAFYTLVLISFKNLIVNVSRQCTCKVLNCLSQQIAFTQPEFNGVSFFCFGHFLSRFHAYWWSHNVSSFSIVHNSMEAN